MCSTIFVLKCCCAEGRELIFQSVLVSPTSVSRTHFPFISCWSLCVAQKPHYFCVSAEWAAANQLAGHNLKLCLGCSVKAVWKVPSDDDDGRWGCPPRPRLGQMDNGLSLSLSQEREKDKSLLLTWAVDLRINLITAGNKGRGGGSAFCGQIFAPECSAVFIKKLT